MRFADIIATHMKDGPCNELAWLSNETYLQFRLTSDPITESELVRMIWAELNGKCRDTVINRLYSKFTTLRKERERIELYKLTEEGRFAERKDRA